MLKPILILLLSILFIGCSDDKPKKMMQKQKTNPIIIVEAPKVFFEKITHKNVVERLTAYGKENPETTFDIYTSKGKIRIELFKDTPLHRANFVLQVKSGYLNKTLFSRVDENFMAQFGGSYDNLQRAIQDTIGSYTIPSEMSHHHFHKKGAVAAARSYINNPEKRSACDEMYLVEGLKYSDISLDHYEYENNYTYTKTQRNYYKNNPGSAHIDGEHTVFGQIIEGFSVVPKITHVNTDSQDWPVTDIYIDSITIVR